MVPADQLALAVDVGGTKLVVGIVNGSGQILAEHRASTPGHDDADHLFSTLTGLVKASLADSPRPPDVCGVGSGGPMDKGGVTVSPMNIAVWDHFPLKERLAELLHCVVAVDNDAKALALGEGWLGAARGSQNYLAMVVSTGVGGGIVLDGRLLDGRAGNAGHIGHVVVEPEGHTLPGRARGCLEAEASGTGIAAITGRPAAEADEAMRRRTGRLVGRAVGSLANLLDLDLAVVAGSVALGFGDLFFDEAQAEVDRVAVIQHSVGTRIVRAGLGSDGPLVGAAAVGFVGLGHDVLEVGAS